MYENEINTLKETYELEKDRLQSEKESECLDKQKYEALYDEVSKTYELLKLDFEDESNKNSYEIDKLNKEIEVLQISLQEKKEQYSDEIKNSERKFNERLSKEREAMAEQIRKTESDCENSKFEYKNIKDNEKDILMKLNKEQAEEIKLLNSKLQDIESDEYIKDQTSKITDLNETLNSIKKRAKEDINNLTKQNQILFSDNQKYEDENQKRGQLIDELQKRLVKTRNQLKETQQKVEVNKNLKDQTDDTYDQLQNDIKRLRYTCKQQQQKIHQYEQREQNWQVNIENIQLKTEEEVKSIRVKLQSERDKSIKLNDRLSKQAEMIEKEKKKMQNKETETFIKIQEQTSLISELKKQIRMLKNIEIDNKISSSINDMTQHNLRTTKSQLELNSKVSETVLYAPQDDNSINEPINKQYHKRRPSSLSSAERVFRARYQDYSPKYDYPSNMDESYVSKGYGDDVNQSNCLDDFQPEREIDSFHNQREIKQLSMSYLEEDYEEQEYVSKTQRDSRTNSRQQKKEVPYKPSPIAIPSINSKNLKPNQQVNDGSLKPGQVVKSNSIKKMPQNKQSNRSNVLSPSDFSTNYKTSGYKDRFTDDFDPNTTEYIENLETSAPKNELTEYIEKSSQYQCKKKVQNKQGYRRPKRDAVLDIIDSQTHNTFDNGGYEEDSFAQRLGSRDNKDFTLTDLNHTYGDTKMLDHHRIARASKEINNRNKAHKPQNESYRSKERTMEYEDIEEEYVNNSRSPIDDGNYTSHLEQNQLRKIKSKNNLKPNFDRFHNIQAADYADDSTYTSHKNLREYQPKQKITSNSKKRNQPSPLPSENPTFQRKGVDEDYFLNETEIPSKLVEKQLRHKSVENHRKIKRSRMGNQLYQVSKNYSSRHMNDSSPNNTKESQYMTHQMDVVHVQMEKDYNENRDMENNRRYAEQNRIERSVIEADKYLTSPHVPLSFKPSTNQKRTGKSSSRSNTYYKSKKPSYSEFQENVPENVMKNMQNNRDPEISSRTSKKHNDLVNALKERELYKTRQNPSLRTHESANEVDDTFTYSMETDGMFNSRLAHH